MLSYTGMVYVLSFGGFLDVILHRGCYMFSLVEAFLVVNLTQGWCMFSPVEVFLMLS